MNENLHEQESEANKICKITSISYLMEKWELSLTLLVDNRIKYSAILIDYDREFTKAFDLSVEDVVIEQIKGEPEILKLKQRKLELETACLAGELKIQLIKARYEQIKPTN